jgi:hypothetical protein
VVVVEVGPMSLASLEEEPVCRVVVEGELKLAWEGVVVEESMSHKASTLAWEVEVVVVESRFHKGLCLV